MTYDEALEYIHGISWSFCKPGLERISELCERLGHPERRLKFIHVAGTNGKGSTSSMLDSVLRCAGYKVGLYTSPYIYRFNERMRVNGESISDEALARITETVRPIADSMADKPTEFELITAIAFLYFLEEACDVVVLEAGMGGRLDSTNVIREPLLSIITGIALDHTAFLGDTVEKIAAEKAGIIKDLAPVLFGGEDGDAEAVIRDTAERLGSPYARVLHGELEITHADLFGTHFSYRGEKYALSLLGLYQPKNAATVIEAVELLRKRGLEISDAVLHEGLRGARWRGRFEIIMREPTVIFDGAHNPEGIASAVESIKHYLGEERVYVFSGVLRDKDYSYIASRISEVASRAYTITPDNPRALTAEEYAGELQRCGVEALHYSGIGEALAAAIADAKKDGRVLVCLGSLYTYVDVMNYIENTSRKG